MIDWFIICLLTRGWFFCHDREQRDLVKVEVSVHANTIHRNSTSVSNSTPRAKHSKVHQPRLMQTHIPSIFGRTTPEDNDNSVYDATCDYDSDGEDSVD